MDQADQQKVFDIVNRFVDKSGGPDQVRKAVKALRMLADTHDDQIISEYVVSVGKQPAGAKQLVAAALLGFSVASALYKRSEGERYDLQ